VAGWGLVLESGRLELAPSSLSILPAVVVDIALKLFVNVMFCGTAKNKRVGRKRTKERLHESHSLKGT
jgi:hypothetical protein